MITFIAGVQLLLLPITRNLVWPLGDRRLARSADVLPHPDQRLFGPPLRRVPLDNLTSDFEPEAYRRYYPDLVNSTDAQLAEHYLSVGRSQDRVRCLRHKSLCAINAAAATCDRQFRIVEADITTRCLHVQAARIPAHVSSTLCSHCFSWRCA